MASDFMVTQSRVFQNGSAQLSARVEDRPTAYLQPGTPIVTSQIASLLLTVYDRTAGGTTIASYALTTASVWFDTLQAWSKDNRGYNFLTTIAPGVFTAAGHEYRIDVQVTLINGRVGWIVFDVAAESTSG